MMAQGHRAPGRASCGTDPGQQCAHDDGCARAHAAAGGLVAGGFHAAALAAPAAARAPRL